MLSIGEIAERTGLSVKLVRHWSDIGVVPASGRSAGGYRRFDEAAVGRLELARSLRELGLGMSAIRQLLDGERTVAEVAALHADAVTAQIRALRVQCAVLRAVARRGATAEELAAVSGLARLSTEQRHAIVQEFLAGAVGEIDASGYRDGLLAVTPDLPDEPSDEQIDAWIELAELVQDPRLQEAVRGMAKYAAAHAPATPDERDVAAAEALTDLWVGKVAAAIDSGVPADSPAADAVVAEVVEAWLPLQYDMDEGENPRRKLLEQLEVAADARAERYWQLLCVINGQPVRASIAREGQWLMTALRANPTPGALADSIANAAQEAGTDVLAAYERVVAEVDAIVAAVTREQFTDPTPCAAWTVEELLNHLVYENLMWTSLAEGNPRSDFTADHLGGDHVGAFREAATKALIAFQRPGMLTQEYGPARGWRIVEQVTIELLVHGWDLAAATGQDTDLAPGVATALLGTVEEIYRDLPRTEGGSFGPLQSVPEGATAADRLAAFLGRAFPKSS
ncbi:TIGR03086 family metal-binding protein [Dactylosporangium sp. AC04546]|uniref:TIGR03086 family metal-binding protein n=1 Tax=Dactylosporangium sp. AC04546 TaxID=2862460 RepID=UPI001EDF7CD3|nr:TIGR03086 family metal-binding protein [Dactylosporangium sp. AC04546]WVK86370.1 TIGR03086 family metal-binding protein [Dactylosporangium sp. AC04546]